METETSASSFSKKPKLPAVRLHADAVLPTRAHSDDAGLDLYSLEGFELGPGQGRVARTGIAVALPRQHVGLVADRSSMAKRGIKTSGGVIDAGYRGEIHIVLWNISAQTQTIGAGERIAQLLILPISTPAPFEVEQEIWSQDATERGAKGFGSSGK